MIELYNKLKSGTKNRILSGDLSDNCEYLITDCATFDRRNKLKLEITEVKEKSNLLEVEDLINLNFQNNDFFKLNIDIIKRNVEIIDASVNLSGVDDYGYSYHVLFDNDYQVIEIKEEEIIASTIDKKNYEDLSINIEHLKFFLNNFNDLTEEKKDIFKLNFDSSIEDLKNLNNLKNKLNAIVDIINNKSKQQNTNKI